MSRPTPSHATLDDWIAREAIPLAVDSPEVFDAAVDEVIAALGDAVDLLGFGEALHGGADVLTLRNRLFRRLVEAHGYHAIALESSFPRARLVNEYVAGRGPASSEAARNAGFSHGFGRLDANRELVEWMRRYNADPTHPVKLRFYGFDSPTEMTGADSPRQLLQFVLDYLAAIDPAGGGSRRERIDRLLGEDAAWENPAALTDPTRAIGRSPAAGALRIETEELISELHVRRPELVAKSDEGQHLEAMQHASVARQLLNYHAALARASDDRFVRLLGIRDAMMADNLVYAVSRERGRGTALAFAHNSHLQRGMARWQLGPDGHTWSPAGARLDAMLGPRYAVIGSAVATSEANGIGRPEAGTLEARLTAAPGPARFIPTRQGQGLPAAEIADLPIRSGSTKNLSYVALTPQSLTDFDWLAVLGATAYDRGGPPLLPQDAGAGPQDPRVPAAVRRPRSRGPSPRPEPDADRPGRRVAGGERLPGRLVDGIERVDPNRLFPLGAGRRSRARRRGQQPARGPHSGVTPCGTRFQVRHAGVGTDCGGGRRTRAPFLAATRPTAARGTRRPSLSIRHCSPRRVVAEGS